MRLARLPMLIPAIVAMTFAMSVGTAQAQQLAFSIVHTSERIDVMVSDVSRLTGARTVGQNDML